MALRPLDPSIVNFYQPPKLNLPDPLQDLASIEQIKSGKVSRKLHEQQLAQLQRDNLALEEMKQVLVSKGQSPDLDAASDAMIRTGIPHVMDVGFKIKQKRDFQKNFELAMGGGAAPPAQPAPVATTAPVQGPVMSVENLSGGGTGVKMRSNLPEQAPAPTNALTPSGFPTNFGDNVLEQIRELERQRKGLTMLAAENPQITPMVAELSRQIAKLREPQTFSPGQTVYVPGQAPFTLPSAPQRPIGVSRGETLYGPNGEVIARGMAPEAPAPTITEIRNPQNPDELIRVDARTGRVIGVSGKEPAAAAREAKVAVGKNELSSELDNIRAAYNNLNEMRAIPSTGRNVLSNIAAGTAASGVGQAVGRLAGTPEQTERDVIKSGRLRLVNAIKNATGMSAQQLNSNVELKNMLDSVTDPSQSIETVNRILDQIQETYLTGAAPAMGRPAAAKPAARPSAPATPAGKGKPSVDDLLKKYGG
ncbi:MAG: hypothetical protein EBQ98_00315 [Actinobacteria bacterium]|nr:hypothetical protein [Actinomycetota bacterium]